MKNSIKTTVVVSVFLSLVLILYSCKKGDVPTVVTISISNITGNSARGGGEIISEGSSTVTSRGVCWSTDNRPTINGSKTIDGAGAGAYYSKIESLNGATVYYIRAYAINEVGVGYGMAHSFTTMGKLPVPTITNVVSNNPSIVTINGVVNPNYLLTTVTFEYGTTTSYGNIISATQSPIEGNANTTVTAVITGLLPGTTYHCRIIAVNSIGTTYSGDLAFKTLGEIPTVTTLTETNKTAEEVQLNGLVNPNYLSSDVTFEYGTTTSYGNTAIAAQSPVTGNANVNVSAHITNLIARTTYHYRIVATNTFGTTKGNDITFTTSGEAPLVQTNAATNTTPTTAQLNGNVLANFITTIATFEYGTTTDYGSVITANQSPVTGNISTPLFASLSNLTLGTTYHYRIVATNSAGTTYGDDRTFVASYVLGATMHGGLIFYIDETREHGLVCAEPTQGQTVWGCTGQSLTGADSKLIGAGYQNTIDIILGCPTEGIAAKRCYELVLNGFSDWFLPSVNECDLMYKNLRLNLGIGHLVGEHWTSSEADSGNAYGYNFSVGIPGPHSKSTGFWVRAVRAF